MLGSSCAAVPLHGINFVVVLTVTCLTITLFAPTVAIYQEMGQVRVPGWQGISRDPWGERAKWAALGYMPTMKREGIETMDYGRGRTWGRRLPPTPLAAPSSTSLPPSNSGGNSDEITWIPYERLNIDDIMAPVETERPIPHAQMVRNPITPKVLNQSAPIGTNKFWSNMASLSQGYNVFTQPYVYRWDHYHGVVPMWGITIGQPGQYRNTFAYTTHSDALKNDPANAGKGRRGFHITEETDTKHYGTPAMRQPFHISAREMHAYSNFFLKETTHMSALIVLTANDNTPGTVRFPLCQGSGFVTALYDNLTPVFESEETLLDLIPVAMNEQELGDLENPVQKWQLDFGRAGLWWVYMIPTIDDKEIPWSEPSYEYPILVKETITKGNITRTRVVAKERFHGIVQVVHVYGGRPEGFRINHDDHAGRFCIGATVPGKIVDGVGYYGIVWKTDGLRDKELMMYALPHHMQTMDIRGIKTGHTMRSTTKGRMTAVFGDVWRFREPDLPLRVGMYPWIENEGRPHLSERAFRAIKDALDHEGEQEFDGSEVDDGGKHDSMYWSGKNMAKRAWQCITAASLYGERSAESKTCTSNLRMAYSRLVTNHRKYPLAYDETWGGLVNCYGFVNMDNDYGNLAYNDHHFHYGYLVFAGAVLARLDPGWLTPRNKNYVNSLVRDYNNPSQADPYFPVFRSFDWFHGHSWAHGIREQPDGRDQESFSEDTLASYAIKLWGEYTNQPEMLGRGALMLAIQKRVIDTYIHMREVPNEGEDIHPGPYRENRIASITFDGKMDTTTFFGHALEFIHGIHMVPFSPITKYTRDPDFAREVWDKDFSRESFWVNCSDEWRATIVMGKAVYDPKTAWDWFMSGWNPRNQTLVRKYIDTGASLAWYFLLLGAWGGDPGEDGFWDKSLINRPRDTMVSPLSINIPQSETTDGPTALSYPYCEKDMRNEESSG